MPPATLCCRCKPASVTATPEETAILRQHSTAYTHSNSLKLVPVAFILEHLQPHLPAVSSADLQHLLQSGWDHCPALQLRDRRAAAAERERELREAREREQAEEEVADLPDTLEPLELPLTFDPREQHSLRRLAPHLLARGQPLSAQIKAYMRFLTSKFRCLRGQQHTCCACPCPLCSISHVGP